MKYSHTRFIAFTIGAVAAGLSAVSAQSTKPVIITPPAVKDGSNASRAPFPAAREFDDVKAPDGQAIDNTAPNTPAANLEPAIPPAPVAVLQPAPATAIVVAPAPTVVVTEPVLTPTGRSTVVVASSLDAAAFTPIILSTTMASRDQMLSDIEMRLTNSEKAMDTFRSSVSQMSADGRRQFGLAEEAVKDSAKELKKSIKAAKKATDDAEWNSARAQLAADYAAYAAAVASVDASTAR